MSAVYVILAYLAYIKLWYPSLDSTRFDIHRSSTRATETWLNPMGKNAANMRIIVNIRLCHKIIMACLLCLTYVRTCYNGKSFSSYHWMFVMQLLALTIDSCWLKPMTNCIYQCSSRCRILAIHVRYLCVRNSIHIN
jgi:hypothetical protein